MPSSRQSDEEYFHQLKLESRRKFRRNSGYLSAALLILILVLALIGSSQVLLVSIMYLAILLEGIALAMFVSNYDVNWSVESLASIVSGRKPPSEPLSRGRDLGASMSVFVKYASQGSYYSRHEVALMLKHMLEKSGIVDQEISPSVPHSSQFMKDLNDIVYKYTNDDERAPKNSRANVFGVRSVSRREREAYLDKLERIIKYVEAI